MISQEMIHVRSVEPEDLSTVYEIAQNSFKDPYSMKLLKHIYNTDPDGFLIAEVKGEVVGYLIGAVRWRNVGHILAIAVRETFRHKGTGTALMLNALDKFSRNGANRVKLEVRISNEVAQSFYDKVGFQSGEIIPGYYSDGEAAISMEYEFD